MPNRDLPQPSQPLLCRWLFVLIGDNNSGKTSFQRHLIRYLCDLSYARLPRDTCFNIRHPRAPRNFATLATANRSYQEKRAENGPVERYLRDIVKVADVTNISCHAGNGDLEDVTEILRHARRRYYNVGAVFFENARSATTEAISALDWQDRVFIRNPTVRAGPNQEETIQEQLRLAAVQFGDMLIARTSSC